MKTPVILSDFYHRARHEDSKSFQLDYFDCVFVSACDPSHALQVQLHRYQVDTARGIAFLQRVRDSQRERRPGGVAPWAGLPNSSLQLSKIRPLARCRAYEISVPCPRRAISILEESKEYKRCLAIPQVTWVRVGLDSRNRDLVLHGISRKDLVFLEERARQLHEEGYLSFVEEYKSGPQ